MKVAVIDIGSNTLKLLVAEKTADRFQMLVEAIEECRISTGIADKAPVLTEDSINRAIEAVHRLLDRSQEYRPNQTLIVATSAVREAQNQLEFCERIKAATGKRPKVISGQEEAHYCALGALADESIDTKGRIHLFDLGGGSLEYSLTDCCKIQKSKSLPLGAVRLTEWAIRDSHLPLSNEERQRIENQIVEVFESAGIGPDTKGPTKLVISGGSAGIARALINGVAIGSIRSTTNLISSSQIERIYDDLATRPLSDRLMNPLLPRNRADVVGAALIVLATVMRFFRVDHFRHANWGLRHGIAHEALNSLN